MLGNYLSGDYIHNIGNQLSKSGDYVVGDLPLLGYHHFVGYFRLCGSMLSSYLSIVNSH